MSVHYLVDPFSAAASVIDVRYSRDGTSPATGAFIVRIPDGVGLSSNPKVLADVFAQKRTAILASFPGYSNVVFDPCVAVDQVLLTSSQGIICGSGLANHCILPNGTLVTTVVGTGLSSAPTQCVVVWETFTCLDADSKDSGYSRIFVEASSSSIGCAISFDPSSGSPVFTSAISSLVTNIPAGHQGTSFQIQFTGHATERRYLGSWAVLSL